MTGTLLCCLEEESAHEMLKGVLPRLLPAEWSVRYMVFEGKKDLLNRLGMRLRGWRTPATSFLVLCDQDAQDCRELKNRICAIVQSCGALAPAKIRIACHELENFYLGDLAAVERGLQVKGLSAQSAKKGYRQADVFANAPEQLKKITGRRYQKLAGSRAIAPHLDLSGMNTSCSFNALLGAIRELTAC